MSKADVLEDYWKVLGLEPGASKVDVQRAYRKKSLSVHPDRYKGDNPEWATAEFLRLTQAKEVLEDDKARAAFEALQKARAAHREKQEAQDAGRRKLREDLEEREEQARKRQRADASGAEARMQQAREAQQEAAARDELQKELERLRRTGRLGGQPQPAPTVPAPSPAAKDTGGDSTEVAGGGERAKVSLRWSADAPMNAEGLTRLLVSLGAPPDLDLAVVGSKAVAELPAAAATELARRSVELAARGIRLQVQRPDAAATTAANAGKSAGAALPSGWREQRTAEGKVYYYHVQTRQTQWTAPTEANAAAGAPAASGGVASRASLEQLESATMARLRQASERQRISQETSMEAEKRKPEATCEP